MREFSGARLSMGAALRCGSTTVTGINTMVFKRWDDAPWEPDIFAVADDLGVRAYLSHHCRSGIVWNEAAGRRGLERAIAFIERLRRRRDDWTRCVVCLHSGVASPPTGSSHPAFPRRSAWQDGDRVQGSDVSWDQSFVPEDAHDPC